MGYKQIQIKYFNLIFFKENFHFNNYYFLFFWLLAFYNQEISSGLGFCLEI
jgi:hypothetical protein